MRRVEFNVITKHPAWNFVAHHPNVVAPSRQKATAQVLEKWVEHVHVVTVPQRAYDKLCDKHNGAWPPLDEVMKL